MTRALLLLALLVGCAHKAPARPLDMEPYPAYTTRPFDPYGSQDEARARCGYYRKTSDLRAIRVDVGDGETAELECADYDPQAYCDQARTYGTDVPADIDCRDYPAEGER